MELSDRRLASRLAARRPYIYDLLLLLQYSVVLAPTVRSGCITTPPPRSLQLCGPNLSSTVPISGLRVCSPRVAVFSGHYLGMQRGAALPFEGCRLPHTGREVQGRRALVI